MTIIPGDPRSAGIDERPDPVPDLISRRAFFVRERALGRWTEALSKDADDIKVVVDLVQ